MTTRYVDGANGNDSWDGLAPNFVTGTNGPKATMNGAEDTPVVAGDHVWVRPDDTAYRELLTCDVSGSDTYSTGTISLTKGSTTVTGSGTTFGGNVAADYYLHVRYYDNGADGVTDGTSTFTAAGGNFHANLIGVPIQINTKGAYIISAVASATSITLSDPNTLGWPTAGSTLTYSVMSGEGHHEIESQDNDTTLTLKQPWQGKTHSGLSYLTFNAITYEGDVAGQIWPVGGVVRVTGSDDDQTAARAQCITANNINYRVFRGFLIDMSSDDAVAMFNGCDYWVIEDMKLMDCVGNDYIVSTGSPICTTIRRCLGLAATGIGVQVDSAGDDTGFVIENVKFIGVSYATRFNASAGNTIRNCLMYRNLSYGCYTSDPTNTGQANYLVNNILAYCGTGLRAQTQGAIIEDYNAFFENAADRNAVGTGANSNAYPPLFLPPILHAGTDQLSGYKFPWLFGELSEWSQIAAIAGVDERNTDLFGITRPVTATKNSWGPVQFHDAERETTTTRGASAASITLHDAGVHHMWVPVTNTSTTISVYVKRYVDYAGTNPRMTIKQPGQADDVTTDAAAANQWNLLTTTLTPAADPPYVVVELQSLNTDVANPATNDVFFDDLEVS